MAKTLTMALVVIMLFIVVIQQLIVVNVHLNTNKLNNYYEGGKVLIKLWEFQYDWYFCFNI